MTVANQLYIVLHIEIPIEGGVWQSGILAGSATLALFGVEAGHRYKIGPRL
jgi:hypothetical protein